MASLAAGRYVPGEQRLLAEIDAGRILAGRQPAELSLEHLLRIGVALDWSEQARQLGFDR